MLKDQLIELLESIKVLHGLLDEERTCLKEKSFDNLNLILSNKQKLLQSIGGSNKAISSKDNLRLIQEDSQLLALKQDIESRLLACQKDNDINGRLIELSMQSNKHLMQVLTQAKGKNTVTYDQKGVLNSASLLGKNIQA
ncbi:flagella synthesis protein FlgN [Psychromonas sp. 14N.309.X.WAT.B.A12]|jgi:flagellar biosynthesis protein FlgN|uniref:flagella synthesis protein FlgN n=1 Tax=unclassified Psychromonas TaxID=2614957 RepID=UPI0025B10712|nr:flagellar protein FlgN [Psychromonas sp. 14N.309.X.WAT.B.A12]MDN2663979.1 flagellar protein FlgN [Psychromonas sp. 14N.309.X.WAT.B.A12]